MSNLYIATYRLQLTPYFNFQQAGKITSYLHDLGVSHSYTSPFLSAKSGSLHGYDIVDYSRLNPEIGNEEDFDFFVKSLWQFGLKLVCDIVPNHMYIRDSLNLWWCDVLENGLSSPYADYFDINWTSEEHGLHNKILLPFLGKQYGEALENQELKVIYQKGAFFLKFSDIELPTDPKSWILIFSSLEKEADNIFAPSDPCLIEFKSILTSLSHLPERNDLNKEKIDERLREKEVIKQRLFNLHKQSPSFQTLIDQHLIILNGEPGIASSFDELETFLNAQVYHLCSWRVANEGINFRRFFDVFEYAGLCTEKPKVFKDVHALVFKFIKKQYINGLRIDHLDGLWDPEQYLKNLKAECQEIKTDSSIDPKKNYDDFFYIIAEKILLGNEKLPCKWPIAGTVGYDFLNQANGLFVKQENKDIFYENYLQFTHVEANTKISADCKKLILSVSLSSELHMLSSRLSLIAQQNRKSRDFSPGNLASAIKDIIAYFPVYRTYISAGKKEVSQEDRHCILFAVLKAKRANAAINSSIFEFIQQVLLLEYPEGLNEKQMNEWIAFVMHFQQLTAPAMGKGLEDTAFYRFYPLSSLNEVGADFSTFGNSIEAFHKQNSERLEFWPYSMITTSTHDTKRSEDVRARINVLSEIPEEWHSACMRWAKQNRQYKIAANDEAIPNANEEYLLYQTLIGTWPLSLMDKEAHLEYVKRIEAYMEKALKEAKINTSWINPNEQYDLAMRFFIQKILDPDLEKNSFFQDFQAFISKISAAGILNSLSQLLLKLTSPGIPDIYQGTEVFNFSLVDPDNRKQVDFELQKALLETLRSKKNEPKELLEELLQSPEDGRLKLLITTLTLHLRRDFTAAFLNGAYLPLNVIGELKDHLIAFARVEGKNCIIVIATRFFIPLMDGSSLHIKAEKWKNTYIDLPKETASLPFLNLFTGKEINGENHLGKMALNLREILDPIPIALLYRG